MAPAMTLNHSRRARSSLFISRFRHSSSGTAAGMARFRIHRFVSLTAWRPPTRCQVNHWMASPDAVPANTRKTLSGWTGRVDSTTKTRDTHTPTAAPSTPMATSWTSPSGSNPFGGRMGTEYLPVEEACRLSRGGGGPMNRSDSPKTFRLKCGLCTPGGGRTGGRVQERAALIRPPALALRSLYPGLKKPHLKWGKSACLSGSGRP